MDTLNVKFLTGAEFFHDELVTPSSGQDSMAAFGIGSRVTQFLDNKARERLKVEMSVRWADSIMESEKFKNFPSFCVKVFELIETYFLKKAINEGFENGLIELPDAWGIEWVNIDGVDKLGYSQRSHEFVSVENLYDEKLSSVFGQWEVEVLHTTDGRQIFVDWGSFLQAFYIGLGKSQSEEEFLERIRVGLSV